MSIENEHSGLDFPEINDETWRVVEAGDIEKLRVGGTAIWGEGGPDGQARYAHALSAVSLSFAGVIREGDNHMAEHLSRRGPLTHEERTFLREGFVEVPRSLEPLKMAITSLQRHTQLSRPVEVLALGSRGLANTTLFGERRTNVLRQYMQERIPGLPFPELPSPSYAAFLTDNATEIPAFFVRTISQDKDCIMPLVGVSLFECLRDGVEALPPQLHATGEATRVIRDLHGYTRVFALAHMQQAELGFDDER